MVPGEVAAGKYMRYTLEVTDPKALVTILLTQFSGDADVYVSPRTPPTKKEFTFKAESVGNEFLFISPEERKKEGRETGEYHVAVYGVVTGAFALTVRADGNVAKPLLPGLRESGSVKQGKLVQYVTLLPDLFEGRVVISLTSISGSPSVFSKRCMERGCKIAKDDVSAPGKGNHYEGVYYSRNSGGSVEVPVSGKNCGDPCTVAIGVYGENQDTSRYFLDISTNATSIITLSSISPYSTWLPTDSALFFRFYEAEDTCDSLEFVLTPISGNPDLFISRKVKRPDRSTADRQSTQAGTLIDSIEYTKSTSLPSLQGQYYLSILSDLPSSFSLMVKEHFSTDIPVEELLPGLPQEVHCPFTEAKEPCIRLFTFYISSKPTPSDIKLLLISIRGSTTLRLTCSDLRATPDSTFKWSFGFQSMSILPASDPQYCEKGVYTLLAETEMTLNEPGRYRVAYTTGEPVVIGGNWLLSDSVEANKVNYYRWRVNMKEKEARVKVETMAGRTENYISYSGEVQKPDSAHYSIKWRGYRSVTLDFSDEKVRKECNSEDYCTVYLGVSGLTNANYTLLAEDSGENVVVLTVGSLVSAVSKREYTHFVAPIKKEKPVHVFLQPINFDVNLYVNVQADSDQVLFPTISSHHFKSENALLLAESLTLLPSSLNPLCPSWSCSLVISIYSYSLNSKFDLEVDQSNVPLLLESKPRQGTVTKSDPMRVRFYCPYNATTLLVSLTRLSGGDPDLYISRKTAPTTTEYDWKSTTFGSDFLLLSNDDPIFAEGSMRGFYYVAAYSNHMSEVTVTYAANVSPPVSLIAGVPVSYFTQKNAISYFYISINKPEYDLLITLTPLTGRATVYVHPQNLILDDIYERLPTASNYTWTTARPASRSTSTLRISRNDPQFCSMACNFVIGVVSEGGNCSYSLVAREEIQMEFLQSGVPVRGSVRDRMFDVFAYRVTEDTGRIRIAVMGISGDMDLFVSTKIPISAANSFNSSQSLSGFEALEISPTSLRAPPSFLYIGVYGSKGGSYSLLLTTERERRVRVVKGWSQQYAVRFDEDDYLLFEYLGREAVCKVRSQGRNFGINVYTSYSMDKDLVPSVSSSDHNYTDSSAEYDEYSNQLSIPLSPAGRHLLSVFGTDSRRHGPSAFRQFALHCTEAAEAVYMKAGSEDLDTLTATKRNQTYYVEMQREGVFEGYLTSCSGIVRLRARMVSTGEDVIVISTVDGGQEVKFVAKEDAVELEVWMEQGDKDLEVATYHLVTSFTPKGQVVKPSIIPGKNGEIVSESLKSSINLTWAPPQFSDGEALDPTSIVYRIFTTNEPDTALQSYCGIRIAAQQHKARRATREDLIDTHFELKMSSAPLIYLIVVAIISLPDYPSSFSFIPYEVIAITTTSQEESTNWVRYLSWGLVVALVLCIIATIRSRASKRAASRSSSEYEMMGATGSE